jgi:hypothetical protein
MPQKLTTKSRIKLPVAQELGVERVYITSGGNPEYLLSTSSPGRISIAGVKETVQSVGHRGPPYKEGGPFKLYRFGVYRNPIPMKMSILNGTVNPPVGLDPAFERRVFDGLRWYASDFSGVPLEIPESYLVNGYNNMVIPPLNLESYGATAFAKYSPLNPAASMGQSLVELYRDGLPNLPLRLLNRTKSLAGAGGEYLNAEFGWKPLLKDLRDMYNTWNSLNSRIAQIIRDHNKGVRRRGSLYRSVVTSKSSDGLGKRFEPQFAYETVDTDVDNSFSQGETTTTTSDKVWFSGRFRYYIPDVTDDRWTRKAKAALFGLTPSPSLLYNVLPWSWLIDWFSNVGDVISNLSSNGIADVYLDYGYVMRHYCKDKTTIARTRNYKEVFTTNSKTQTVRIPSATFQTLVREQYKERVAATPFGFGLQLHDLSVRQYAILTALGLSRQNFV